MWNDESTVKINGILKAITSLQGGLQIKHAKFKFKFNSNRLNSIM